MNNIDNTQEWVGKLNEQLSKQIETSLQSPYVSQPIHDIIKQFNQRSNELNVNSEEHKILANKIKLLSEKKNEYYQKSRFGFIKRFFSSLHNVLSMGRFISSGQLGLELSDQFLKKIPAISQEVTPKVEEPSTIESPPELPTVTIEYGDGKVATGKFQNDKNQKLKGEGILSFPGKEQWIGTFENGQLHGKGTIIYATNEKWEADFVNGYPEGEGIITHPSGKKWKVIFAKGKFEGPAEEISPDGKVVTEGICKDYQFIPNPKKEVISDQKKEDQ